MTEYLYTTFGSEEVLQSVREKNPDRVIMLSVDDNDPKRFQLIEKTNKPSVFSLPTTYKILFETDVSSDIRGWMNFTFITMPDQERDNFVRRCQSYLAENAASVSGLIDAYILQRTDNPNQLAIFTTWTLKEYWTIWMEDSVTPLTQYQAMASKYGFRNSQYTFAKYHI